MKVPAELASIARRVVWDEPVEYTLDHPELFLTHLMIYGTIEDITTTRRYFNDQAFREALQNAPAGLFDLRSWNYWHVVLNATVPPPLPSRQIGDMQLPYEPFPSS